MTLKLFLTVALRNLKRFKLYSIINILGLTLATLTSLIILLWVQKEFSYNKQHANYENIYQVFEHQYRSDRVGTTISTPAPLAPYLKENFPEVEAATRITWRTRHSFQVGDQVFNETGRNVDADFFKIFSFDFIHGNAEQPFEHLKSVVLTEKLAEKYFGEENPVGKTILLDNETTYTVSAVVKSWADNTSYGDFDYLLNFEDIYARYSWLPNWNNNNVRAFILTVPGVNKEDFNAKIELVVEEHRDGNMSDEIVPFVHPLADVHLRSSFAEAKQSGGRIRLVLSIGAVGVFILVLAAINFMMLSTAVVTARSKELGIKKTLGSSKHGLMTQVVGEALFQAVIAGLIGIQLLYMLEGWVESIAQVQITMSVQTILVWTACVILPALLGSLYPIAVVGFVQTKNILRGELKFGEKASLFRKGLIVLQFSITILMLFSSLVVFRQLDYMLNQDLGFDKDDIVYLRLRGEMSNKVDELKAELFKYPEIHDIAFGSAPPLQFGNSTPHIDWVGKDPQTNISFRNISIDENYFNALGVPLLAGRMFSEDLASDSTNLILNETGAHAMGFTAEEAIGQPVTLWGEREGYIVGVVADFVFSSSRQEIRPLVANNISTQFGYLIVKGDLTKSTKVLDGLNEVYAGFAPDFPIEYTFLRNDWDELYEDEKSSSGLLQIFVFVSIFISCLGLFGIAAFTLQQRTKEVGIRKVLGATFASIYQLISFDYLKLILVSALLGIPIAWWLMSSWLDNYSFRIELTYFNVLAPLVSCLLIALATVSYHSIRSANINPAVILKDE